MYPHVCAEYMYLGNTIAGESFCGEVALNLKIEGSSHEEMWE